jgi:putative hemolysin
VYDDNLDQILGVLHVKELMRALLKPDSHTLTTRALTREMLFVPETNSVNDLLHTFRDRHTHIAIVLDEYGGTAGLVTLEDLLEEIVGEVSGPFDHVNPEIQLQPDGSYLIDGMTLIEEVNEQIGLNLHESNYDTIAGYVLGRLGRIPKVGEALEEGSVRLQVERMDGLRIANITIKRLS